MDKDKWLSIFAGLKGVDALVIGGSRSRGEADVESDTDIGLYYNEAIDFDELENAIKVIMDDTRLSDQVLYRPGEWGPWVNGGAWLTVHGEPYDLILRETSRVERVIRDSLAGRVEMYYQAGHPFGFVSTIYAAEVHYAELLWERREKPLTALKELLHSEGTMPPKLKGKLVERFLFEAEFSMESARKAALRGDIHYVSGAFFRTAGCWNQVLFALNDRYLMNEKGSLQAAARLAIVPGQYQVRVYQIYHYLGEHSPRLAFKEYEMLQEELMQLAAEQLQIS